MPSIFFRVRSRLYSSSSSDLIICAKSNSNASIFEILSSDIFPSDQLLINLKSYTLNFLATLDFLISFNESISKMLRSMKSSPHNLRKV